MTDHAYRSHTQSELVVGSAAGSTANPSAISEGPSATSESSEASPSATSEGVLSCIMGRVKMYELDNDQPDGVDLPDGGHNSYRNQWLLEDFLHKNKYPITLDWGNQNMKFIVLIEDGNDIVGLSALIPYKKHARKVHLCAMLVVERLRRRGLGTEMLKRIVVLYPHNEVTLSVLFEQCDVLNFYMNKEYARLKSVDTEKRCFVLSLVNLKLLQDVSLPD